MLQTSTDTAASPLVLLVIRDTAGAESASSHIFEQAQFRVVQAPGVNEALELLRDLRPAVVVLETSTPIGAHWTFMERLSAVNPDPVPVAVLSRLADDGERSSALSAGVAAFFPIPFEPESLVRTIRALAYTQDALDRRKDADRRRSPRGSDRRSD